MFKLEGKVHGSVSRDAASCKPPAVIKTRFKAPNLTDSLCENLDVDGIDADTVAGAFEELAEKINQSDGLVNGQDFLTLYKLERDN